MYNGFMSTKQVGEMEEREALTGHWHPKEERRATHSLEARAPPPDTDPRWLSSDSWAHFASLTSRGASGPTKTKHGTHSSGYEQNNTKIIKARWSDSKLRFGGWPQRGALQQGSTEVLGRYWLRLTPRLVGQSREL